MSLLAFIYISKLVWLGNTKIIDRRQNHGTVRKRHKTKIATENKSKSNSFLFLRIISKLERTQRNTPQNKGSTQNFHTNWEKRPAMNKHIISVASNNDQLLD